MIPVEVLDKIRNAQTPDEAEHDNSLALPRVEVGGTIFAVGPIEQMDMSKRGVRAYEIIGLEDGLIHLEQGGNRFPTSIEYAMTCGNITGPRGTFVVAGYRDPLKIAQEASGKWCLPR